MALLVHISFLNVILSQPHTHAFTITVLVVVTSTNATTKTTIIESLRCPLPEMDSGSSRYVKWTRDALLTADPNHNSEANMTGKTPDTMRTLDECVKVAEMSALKFVNDSLQPYQTPYYQVFNIQYKIANEGFPKFSKLPAELRSKVWEDAMPPYGFFTALMLGREEPRPQQPPPPAILAFRVVYRLEPVPRGQQDDALRMRLDTMRAIQRTNSEAASEVQRVFPTTINCTGGKLRFNAEHDTLSLSDLQCVFKDSASQRFGRYSQGAVGFADDWHKIPRKMVLNNSQLFCPLGAVNGWLQFSDSSWNHLPPYIQYVEGFMQFLADCTALRSFGIMYSRACRDTVLEELDSGRLQYQRQLRLCARLCDPAPIMEGLFYGDEAYRNPLKGLDFLLSVFLGLKAIIHGLPPDQKPPGNWPGIRFGRPELQNLHIQAMLPASPALSGRMKKVRAEDSEAETNQLERPPLVNLTAI